MSLIIVSQKTLEEVYRLQPNCLQWLAEVERMTQQMPLTLVSEVLAVALSRHISRHHGYTPAVILVSDGGRLVQPSHHVDPVPIEHTKPAVPPTLVGQTHPCGLCGNPSLWKCIICQKRICRAHTLTIPGSVPLEYYGDTLCSQTCWIAAGKPED